MDCEKFESTMLDELYGELDELTLAASKRHVGGCARCAALMAGFRATRKLVTLPVLAPSEGFEGRLLSAVAAAEAKPRLGLGHVISMAGRWAMRPSTAMAAVFLLMVGSSSVLLSRKAPRSAMDSSAVTVTENGAPAPVSAAPMASAAAPFDDPGAAAAAHGTAPIAPAAPMARGGPGLGSSDDMDKSYGLKRAAPSKAGGFADGLGNSMGTSAGGGGAPGAASRVTSLDEASNHSDPRFAPAPPAAPPSLPSPAPIAAPAATTPSQAKDDGSFGAAMQQYRQQQYPAAAQSFDALAAGGDSSAALYAARSVREGAGGCAAAAAKFDQVAGSAFGSATGYDATLEGAQCYARLGQTDQARSRYNRLLTVPAYASRAQQGINAISGVAARAAAKPTLKSATVAPSAPAGPPAATDR